MPDVALAVHQKTPRNRTEENVALAEEAAGRAWAEVERSRAEAGLRASEARFRALAETAPLAVAATSQEEGPG